MNKKVAIITFHNTPNYGATLQCYALFNFLTSRGLDVEVVNYMPPHNLVQYAKSLFLGKRRSLKNIQRILRFYSFVKANLRMSGGPMFFPSNLSSMQAKKYALAVTGSDEVWKVDHMRRFDPSYYLSFLDTATTRLVAYAATASTVTDLRHQGAEVPRLLARFSALGIRDESTLSMVKDLTDQPAEAVLDPTLIWDFGQMDLPPLLSCRYVAVYSWLSDTDMGIVRDFANRHDLKVACVGCRHKDADVNLLDIGPEEWLRLIKHSAVVVTDFFHGVLFAVSFKRPFYVHVDEKKKMKLYQALQWFGVPDRLQPNLQALKEQSLSDLAPDWDAVHASLGPLRTQSVRFLDQQIAAIQAV